MPLSPNQAAQVLVSAEPKVQGLVQKPQSGPNPNVKLVSGRPRCRSLSPRCRLDVDVGPEGQAGGRIGLGPVSCQEGLLVPPAWEVTSPDSDPLSKSFPPLQPSTKRHLYALAHNSADCLLLPTDLQRSVSSEYLKSTDSAACWDADLSLVSISFPLFVRPVSLFPFRFPHSSSYRSPPLFGSQFF